MCAYSMVCIFSPSAYVSSTFQKNENENEKK